MNSTPSPQRMRVVERQYAGQATQDGAGVKLTRLLTADLQQRLDPFLMLDNFASDDPQDYGAGFPNHPHRGFETITYMIQGRMRHQDSGGHAGLLQNGGMQWMTAGRGLIHSEMPEQEDGTMEGFQLWLNLPARDKLCEPWYRDFQAADIPSFTLPSDNVNAQGQPWDVSVRLIAGQIGPHEGAVQRDAEAYPTQPLYADVTLPPGAQISFDLAPGHNAFVVVYRASLRIADALVARAHLAVLSNAANSQGVQLVAPPDNEAATRLLLIAGRPLREPIAQYGPFVMNTRDQLIQAVNDFQNGRMG